VNRVKPHLRGSLLQNIKKPSIEDEEEKSHLVISLKHLDRNQGQTFNQWEEDRILADALDVLCGYCHDTLQKQCCNEKFKPYSSFPPPDKTEYYFPSHVPPDAHWACMHVKGKQCVVGHIVRNVFYIVFLDKEHRFWISEKKS
jgi:hypothetical protein